MGAEPFVGQICAFGFNFAPRGWVFCNGQTMSISQNAAMFSLLGTTFGGNGQQTFGIPDLRGRTAIGQGQGPGLHAYVMGQFAGAEAVTLLQTQMPIHTHVATFTSGGGGSSGSITSSLMASNKNATTTVPVAGAGNPNVIAAPYCTDQVNAGANIPSFGFVVDPAPSVALGGLNVALTGGSSGSGTVTNATAGGSQPFGILQPYLTINYCIATEGIFPTRN